MEDTDDEPSPMPLRTPRNAARPPKPTKAKSTNQKRRKVPVFESDDEDSIELFDLGEEEENCTELDSEDDENVNPNASNKHNSNGSKSRGVESQSTRKSRRRRLSSTW